MVLDVSGLALLSDAEVSGGSHLARRVVLVCTEMVEARFDWSFC